MMRFGLWMAALVLGIAASAAAQTRIGPVQAQNNLSDVANPAAALANLGGLGLAAIPTTCLLGGGGSGLLSTSVGHGLACAGGTLAVSGLTAGDVSGLGTAATLNPGTGLTSSGSSLTVTYGTTSGTAAQGNDSRIIGALQSSGGTVTGLVTATGSGAFQVPMDLSTVTATGGTTALTATARATAHLTVEDFGAKGDCVADDTPAFNAYAAYLRGLVGYVSYKQLNLGVSRCYLLRGSVNLTNLSSTIFDGHGSTLVGAVTGLPVLDAVQANYLTLKDFTLIAQGSPLVGIQIGRALNPLSGAGAVSMQNVHADGTFTRAVVYNRAAETSNIINCLLQNRNNSPTSYALIMDGDASWQIVSAFAATYNPSNPAVADPLYPYTNMSFNEQTIVSGALVSYHGPAVWMSNFRGHSYIDAYVASYAQDSGSGPAAVISFAGTDAPNHLLWKVHSESGPNATLRSDFLVTGTIARPVITGFTYSNHIEMAPQRVMAVDTGVTAVTIHDLDLHIPQFSTPTSVVFDDPTRWVVDGRAYVPTSGAFNLLSFTGLLSVNGSVSYSGSLSPTVALPSTINASEIAQSGGVASITVTTPNNWYYGGSIPVVTIAAPPAGGSQAAAVVGTVGQLNITSPTLNHGTGTGYQVNDVVIYNDGNCSIPQQYKIAAVDVNGTPTNIIGNAVIGSCPASEMLLTAVPTTGGHGTGLSIDATLQGWRVITVTVTAPGGGYLTPPTVTFPPGIGGGNAQAVATLSSSLTMAGGAGTVTMNSAGVTLTGAGTSVGGQSSISLTSSGVVLGGSGAPTISKGALIDNSGVRVALTSAGYTVPANTSLVRLIQTTPVASATIVLPTPLADGQPIQFVDYAGAITALTFSPAVNGWTNGSSLAAYSGLRIRWDATSSAWYREQ